MATGALFARSILVRAADAALSRTPTQTKLGIEGLNFHYGAFEALHGITLEIPKHRITALIGPSGCGKSTFLRTLNRMSDLTPKARVEGKIALDGQDLLRMDPMEIRRRVGMVFQRPNPFPKSIFDNVAFGVRVNRMESESALRDTVEQSLRKAALWDEVKDCLHKSAMSLSGGQQQRLCIARALAVKPEVLLFDEPCSALDPISTAKIEEVMMQMREECTMVIVTHNLQQAARISDRTGFFLMGRLVEHNTTGAIFENPCQEETQNYITGRMG
ncbi:MAG: phosphate ABC transporter ATP-binding protein PstB [Bryobacteraceae bacterium]